MIGQNRIRRSTVQARVRLAIDHLKSVHPQWVSSYDLCKAINCPQGSSTDLKNGLIASGLVSLEERPGMLRLWFRFNGEGNNAIESQLRPIDEAEQLRALKAEVFKVAEPLARRYPCELLKEAFSQTFDFLA